MKKAILYASVLLFAFMTVDAILYSVKSNKQVVAQKEKIQTQDTLK